LIDASKAAFAETFLETLRPAIDPTAIDYMVCNHLEPDHSGALVDVLDVASRAQVVVTKPGRALLRAILNRDVKPMIVGDRIDLRGRTLRFISRSSLAGHDVHLSRRGSDPVLRGFLRAHYCDPRLFNDLIPNYDEVSVLLSGDHAAVQGVRAPGAGQDRPLPIKVVADTAPSCGPMSGVTSTCTGHGAPRPPEEDKRPRLL
jgi:hypothetical protein